ncbi:hypothetical protein O1611_g5953 [Lasiodiplodia mahajangana]|uniref:Uncharacterized protein n=1 Tax=Lasiodiplodia mahajangana TaxID=1108764 RepID=A0ACC2JJI0_9PEZI|nr:hypothetical protein O1611_g5953 [Lasiodiplodia mahajangana]
MSRNWKEDCYLWEGRCQNAILEWATTGPQTWGSLLVDSLADGAEDLVILPYEYAGDLLLDEDLNVRRREAIPVAARDVKVKYPLFRTHSSVNNTAHTFTFRARREAFSPRNSGISQRSHPRGPATIIRDFMVRQKYRWPEELDDIEDVERYRPGGFHPIQISDVLGGKYRVLHKLGCGGFSTVWLARDSTDQRLYAVKALAADAPENELDIIRYLRNTVGAHRNVLSLHDYFTIQGPNGSHSCLVLPLLGPSIKQVRLSKVTMDVKRQAATQIVAGLAHLHRGGVCHSDLTHANVLFELRDVDRWSDSEVYQHFRAPNNAELLCLDGSLPPPSAPRHIVEAINFRDIDPELLSGNICIVDFGLSFLTECPPPGIPGTPLSFLAPELCFGAPRSPTNDVWALGCLMFELCTNRVLFPLVFDRLDLLVGTIVDTLGRLPPHWEGCFVNQTDRAIKPGRKDFWYDSSFKPNRPLEHQIGKECPQLPEHQKQLLLQLLAGSLSLDPAQRLRATEMVSHPWFSQVESTK